MSPEERQLLTSLFERTKSAAATPRDGEAEALIGQALRDQPYAAYFLAQAVIVQEQGLKAAADRIQQLEARVHELEANRSESRSEQSGGFLGGLGSLFGGGHGDEAPRRSVPPVGNQQGRLYDDYARNAAPSPQPQQPAGPWNPQPSAPSAAGSFLTGALGTAAGVAGGVMLADSLRGLFGPHLGGFGGNPLVGGGLGAQPVEETTVNNYYVNDDKGQDQKDDDTSDDGQVDYASNDDDDDSADDSFDNDDSSYA